MCGIFGFVSKNPKKTQAIIKGLKALEYRGYDSWGIAVKKGAKVKIEKFTGKLSYSSHKSELAKKESTLSIGHTRWATHGAVTISNSHPHIDCTHSLALVHNGIFENYEEVKEILKKKGHSFYSETDTEVIVHLIEEYMKKYSFVMSVQKTFNSIHGLNAIVVMDTISNEIVALKNGTPLLIGISSDSFYIASDISALAMYSSKIVVLKDDQVAILGRKIKIISMLSGKELAPKVENFKFTEDNHKLGTYSHFLIKEIHEQPKILASLYDQELENIQKIADLINSAYGTYMLGCGTASYAALAGEYFLSKIARKHVNSSVGSEFKYLQDFITEKSLIIPISQSGETIDVVEPAQKAKDRGSIIFSIVNVPTSTLARMSNFSIFLHAGQEKAVVGTKSFIAMVGLLLAVAYASANKLERIEDILSKSAVDVSEILSSRSIEKVKQLSKKLRSTAHAFTIGRGVSYVAALEGALKLKETALMHAEGFAGGELKHGVIALIEKGTPCFVFAPNDETYSEIISNAQEIKARGGFIIGIGPKENNVFDEFLKTADLSEATIIPQTVYMQLLAYYLALERGIKDPDKPRNLAKSVTVK